LLPVANLNKTATTSLNMLVQDKICHRRATIVWKSLINLEGRNYTHRKMYASTQKISSTTIGINKLSTSK